MKKYKIKITNKLLNKLKKYHLQMQKLEADFCIRVNKLEKKMEKNTKIKGIYFFRCDGEYCGIGNYDTTMPLVHTFRLEE